jgi:hypothetical protein
VQFLQFETFLLLGYAAAAACTLCAWKESAIVTHLTFTCRYGVHAFDLPGLPF